MKTLTSFAICLTMMALLAGCGNPQNAIVGKWHRGNRIMEFLKDGTVLQDGHEAAYTFPDDRHLKLDPHNGQGLLYKFRIDGDKLFLADEGSARFVELDRVKE